MTGGGSGGAGGAADGIWRRNAYYDEFSVLATRIIWFSKVFEMASQQVQARTQGWTNTTSLSPAALRRKQNGGN